MEALEFSTTIHNGIIKIPESESSWSEQPVKVILLKNESVLKKERDLDEIIRTVIQEIKTFNLEIDTNIFENDRKIEKEREFVL